MCNIEGLFSVKNREVEKISGKSLRNQIFSILDNFFKPEIMKRILQTLLLSWVVFAASAQDPHLSQFYMSPLYLNPALTGAFNGNYRLTGLFRGQWGSVLRSESVPMYRTYTFSADFRTNKGFAKGDAFRFGASFMGDQAGESKFGYNVGGIAVAYHKILTRNNYLAAGFSSQIYQQTIDYTNL